MHTCFAWRYCCYTNQLKTEMVYKIKNKNLNKKNEKMKKKWDIIFYNSTFVQNK